VKSRARRRVLAVVAMLAIAAALGATAPSAHAATKQPASTTAAPTTTAAPAATGEHGITDNSVKVGGLGWALAYGGADVGARARFARANAEGGVNGRMINYIGMRDDNGDPNADQQAAQQLVNSDQVFAVVPVVTPVFAAGSDLAAAKTPFVGWALSSSFCANAYGFGLTGCTTPAAGTVTSNAWGLLLAKALGSAVGKNVAVLTENTPSGQYALTTATASLQSAGFTVPFGQSALPVPAVGDYSALAGKIMAGAAGKPPDVVLAIGGYDNIALLRQALAGANYQGAFTDSIEYDPQLVSAANGVLVMLPTAPAGSAKDVPAIQQLVTDVQKVAPNQPIDSSVIAGYLSADMFLKMLAQVPVNPTQSRFQKAANRYIYDVPDVVGPTRFPKAHTQPTPCGSMVQSDGTAFAVKVPYTCGKVVSAK
jgi:ABC-type branched-subunit amino acid transport system substrate-binding protein